jgi:hypothetical protein
VQVISFFTAKIKYVLTAIFLCDWIANTKILNLNRWIFGDDFHYHVVIYTNFHHARRLLIPIFSHLSLKFCKLPISKWRRKLVGPSPTLPQLDCRTLTLFGKHISIWVVGVEFAIVIHAIGLWCHIY